MQGVFITTHTFEQRLQNISEKSLSKTLAGRRIGIEKESLRTTANGKLSQLDHPRALGAALTHPSITTDFSESLIELVTEPHDCVDAALAQLNFIHQFVYKNIGDELLWGGSMPCLVDGDASIPIAKFGSSNSGMMKTVYRRGLSWRYGRMLQAIAGVHFNFSLPEEFWRALQEKEGKGGSLKDYMTENYFAMVRNLQLISWLVPYLFGASPAICKSFLLGEENSTLIMMGEGTRFQPFATSLRMGDIGYQNSQSGKRRIDVCFNSLKSYSESLTRAMQETSPKYADIGVKVDGEYRQLNDKVLQIENEYYASVRPKAVPSPKEKPLSALWNQGVRYLELRSLDLNVLAPAGITSSQGRFLEAMMIYSMLEDSPDLSQPEIVDIEGNLLAVAHGGRDTEMLLKRRGKKTALSDWGNEILQKIKPICELLDVDRNDGAYLSAWQEQQEKMDEPAATPSARVLDSMIENNESFFDYGLRKSQEHRAWFDKQPIDEQQLAKMEQTVADSLAKQLQREADDEVNFDEYLAAYFSDDA